MAFNIKFRFQFVFCFFAIAQLENVEILDEKKNLGENVKSRTFDLVFVKSGFVGLSIKPDFYKSGLIKT